MAIWLYDRKKTMKRRAKLFAILAWVQLVFSLLFAAAIIWSYIAFHALVGQFVGSVARSIDAVTVVVIRTAETVEKGQTLLVEMQKNLPATRTLIKELRDQTESQAKLAPQYVEGLRATSKVLNSLHGPLQNIGEELISTSIPTDIRMVGVKPVVTMKKPFEAFGKQLKDSADQTKTVGIALDGLSSSLAKDSRQLSDAFIATSNQAIQVIDEAEKTLARLNTEDMPKAIADLKTTSTELRNMSTQINALPNVGLAILVAGLVLALWCIVHSIGSLMMAKSYAFDHTTDRSQV